MGFRLARIEHIIEVALPQFCNLSAPSFAHANPTCPPHSRHSESTADDDDSRSYSEEQEAGGGSFQAGKWYGTTASGSVAPVPVLEQARKDAPVRLLSYST
jgi:hypothetical protein